MPCVMSSGRLTSRVRALSISASNAARTRPPVAPGPAPTPNAYSVSTPRRRSILLAPLLPVGGQEGSAVLRQRPLDRGRAARQQALGRGPEVGLIGRCL